MSDRGNPGSADRVKQLAREAGFDVAGVARLDPLEPGPEARRLRDWLAAGRQGAMAYLERGLERRLDPTRILPGARSVLCVALNHGDPPVPEDDGPGAGRIARYARGRDYHKIFERRLRELEGALAAAYPGVGTRRYVDTGPVLEKLWAERAGLGWRGKHTNLVSRDFGSWLLLGEILLTLDLEPDDPEADHCGSCTRCIDACPTGAITGPYELDARLCVSYLTIELRGPIPLALRRKIGDRVFGCDDCLEVCPWNRFAREAREADFRPRPETLAPLLRELVALDAEEFLERFAGTPVTRARREGLARNACVALGNVGGPGAREVLIEALADESDLVREHARWALDQLNNKEVRDG